MQDITVIFLTHIPNVLRGGRVSKIFHSIVIFHFMLKIGNFYVNSLDFLHFIFLNTTKIYIGSLRHPSLYWIV